MEYQNFSSDKNLVSSEDTIFILHMWRYHGCFYYSVHLADILSKTFALSVE